MILGSENQPQTVFQLASQSHMFYASGGKSIEKNISLSYWFVIDYCFLITQWLMIILFFALKATWVIVYLPAYSFIQGWKSNKAGLDSVSASSPWSGVGPLILTFLWILVSHFSFSCHIALSETLFVELNKHFCQHWTIY